jgi:hypothetical protein
MNESVTAGTFPRKQKNLLSFHEIELHERADGNQFRKNTRILI